MEVHGNRPTRNVHDEKGISDPKRTTAMRRIHIQLHRLWKHHQYHF